MQNIFLKIVGFIKGKLIKFLVSLLAILCLTWLFSGTMIEGWIPSIKSLAPEGVSVSMEHFSFWMKNLAALCLLIALARVIMGLPIWKWIYIPIGLGIALSLMSL